MPVSVKTCGSAAEAAALLASDRGARYIAGGTLVMRALNEGDIGITTLVRLAGRELAQILSLIHISEPTRLRRSRMPSSA